MNHLFSQLQANLLGMTTFSVLAKSTLILVFAWAMVLLQRRRSAALRHMIWTLALTISLSLLMLQLVVPAWKVLPLFGPPLTQMQSAAPAARSIPTGPSPTYPAVKTTPRRTTVSSADVASVADAVPPQSSMAAVEPATTPAVTSTREIDWTTAGFSLWVFGALCCTLFYLVGEWKLRRMASAAVSVDKPEWLSAMQRTVAKLTIRRDVQLLCSSGIEIPLTFGVLRPVIVLPAEAMEWDARRRDTVLLHEVAHIARWDALTQNISHLACAVYWFNPLVWTAARAARFERELACDDFVLAAGTSASGYANELLTMVNGLPRRDRYAVALAMARRSQFEGRLLALLDPALKRGGISQRTAMFAAILALLFAIPLAALQPQDPHPAAAQPATPQRDSNSNVVIASPDAPVSGTAGGVATGVQGGVNGGVAGGVQAGVPGSVVIQQTPEPAPAIAPHAESSDYSVASTASMPAPSAYYAQPALAGVPTPVAAPTATTRQSKLGVMPPANRQTGLECVAGSADKQHSSNMSTEDGNYKSMVVSWSGGACSASLNARGDIKFSEDFSSIQGISADGFAEITSNIHGESRRLSIHPAGNGSLEYVWWVNNNKQPFDDASRKWLANFLTELDRHSAWAVTQRFPALMKEGGAQRILDEVSYMSSDYARSVYLMKLVSDAQLKPQELIQTLDRTRDMGSDYEAARVLMAVAAKYPLNDSPSRNAFLSAVDVINSDYEHARVLMAFFDKGPIPLELGRTILASASKLRSDYEHSRVLVAMTEKGLVDGNTQADFLNSVNNIKSDYEHSRTLIAFLNVRKSDDAAVLGVIKSAGMISSDYERARVLTAAASGRNLSGTARDEYVRVATQIRSEYERNRALAAIAYHATSL